MRTTGPDGITIRRASADDIPDLVRLRRTMFESMGYDDLCQLAAADEAAAAYFADAIPSGEFYGWLAVTSSGQAVGSGGAVIDRHPPGPNNLTGRSGYIMNISTHPAHRRRGIARRMMHAIVRWLAAQGIHKFTLHATEMGRPLYSELGFEAGNEMVLHIAQAPRTWEVQGT
jgi:ribosomal protein S18 acetylase RimI-like enzyme